MPLEKRCATYREAIFFPPLCEPANCLASLSISPNWPRGGGSADSASARRPWTCRRCATMHCYHRSTGQLREPAHRLAAPSWQGDPDERRCPSHRMTNEEDAEICACSQQGHVVKRNESMSFRQWTDRGYVHAERPLRWGFAISAKPRHGTRRPRPSSSRRFARRTTGCHERLGHSKVPFSPADEARRPFGFPSVFSPL
jgi:hypothetical protein